MHFFISPCTAIFHSACFGSAGRTAEHSCFAHIENKQWKWKASSIPNGHRPLQKCPSGPDSCFPVPRVVPQRHALTKLARTSLAWWDSGELATLLPHPPLSLAWHCEQQELAVPLRCGNPPIPTEKGVSRLFVSVTEPTASPRWAPKCMRVQIQFISAYISA